MALPVLLLVLLLALTGCTGEDEAGETAAAAAAAAHRFVAERVVVLGDGSTAVVGVAALPDEDGARADCRPGNGAWDFFASRIGARGRVGRTDLLREETTNACGDIVLSATAGSGGQLIAIAWAVTPSETSSDGHGPVKLEFARDGRTSHSFEAAAFVWDYGPIGYAETFLRGPGGRARAWAPRAGLSGLRLELEPAEGRDVELMSPALPENARLYENWSYSYSLESGPARDGVYWSGPYTRGDEGPYVFPIVKHRLDGRLDRRFGGDGVVIAHPPGARHFVTTQIAVDHQGRVLAVGGADVGRRRVTYVLRFRRDGRLDASFGKGGLVWLQLGSATPYVYADARASIGVRHDGRLLVAGGIQERGSTLWLLRPDGTLVPGFGRGGKVVLTPTG